MYLQKRKIFSLFAIMRINFLSIKFSDVCKYYSIFFYTLLNDFILEICRKNRSTFFIIWQKCLNLCCPIATFEAKPN